MNDTKEPGNDPRYLLDPSPRSTEVLLREISSLKELVFARLNAIEEGVKIAHDDLVRVPTDVQKQVGNLKELHEQRFKQEGSLRDEKFASVQKQFDGNKTAVDAALAAVKEAGNKTESAFIKQIDQLVLLFNTSTKSLEGQIDDIKDRFNRGEGKGEGSRETKSSQQDSNKWALAVLAFILTIVAFVLGRAGI